MSLNFPPRKEVLLQPGQTPCWVNLEHGRRFTPETFTVSFYSDKESLEEEVLSSQTLARVWFKMDTLRKQLKNGGAGHSLYLTRTEWEVKFEAGYQDGHFLWSRTVSAVIYPGNLEFVPNYRPETEET